MTTWLDDWAQLAPLMMQVAAGLALAMATAVVVERFAVAVQRVRSRRLTQRYRPLIQHALLGDPAARDQLLASPTRHRLALGWMLIEPLIDERDPERINRTRALAQALSVFAIAERYLRSWLWWRRALALRALGLAQATQYTADLIAALDDPHADVRAAALDGLADMHDVAALKAIVVRVHDTSLHRGRRGAALKSFGSDCEAFLLEMAEADAANRLNYTHALAICGTARSRPLLCRWTADPQLEIRATAFEALAYVGLDNDAAAAAIAALEHDDVRVRAMAARALQGWHGGGDAAQRLAPHLDDTWEVAVNAARALGAMGLAGVGHLQARAARPGLGGVLAQQMLWQPGVR